MDVLVALPATQLRTVVHEARRTSVSGEKWGFAAIRKQRSERQVLS